MNRVGWRARLSAAVPVLAAAVLAAAHLAALHRESRLPYDEEAPHLLLAARLLDVARDPARAPWEPFVLAFEPWLPLYHLAVALAFAVRGMSREVASGLNALLLVPLAWFTARFTRDLLDRSAAALSGVLAVSLPAVVRLTKLSRPEVTVALLVAATLATLARGRPGWRRALGLGVLLGLGLYSRWSFPLFVAAPLLLAWTGRGLGESRWRVREVGLAAALAMALALPWYVTYLSHFVPPAGALVGLGAAPLGPAGPLDARRWARVVLDHLADAPVRLVLLATVLLLAARLAGLAPATGVSASRRRLLALLGVVAVPCVALTLLRNPEDDVLMPGTPALAALAAWTMAAIPQARARAFAMSAVAVYALGTALLALSPGPLRFPVIHSLRGWPVLHQAVSLDVKEMRDDREATAEDLQAVPWPTVQIVAEVARGIGDLTPSARLLLGVQSATLSVSTVRWQARLFGIPLEVVSAAEVSPVRMPQFDYVLANLRGRPGQDEAEERTTEVMRAHLDEFAVVLEPVGPTGPLTLLRRRRSMSPVDLRPPAAGLLMGEDAARWYLAEGWGDPEPFGRWAVAREAVLRVQLTPGMPYRLAAEIAPYPFLPRHQIITVLYAGVPIGVWRPPDARWRTWEAEVPARLPTGAIDEVRLRFVVVARPAEAEHGSSDGRSLAAAFRRVRFDPLPTARP